YIRSIEVADAQVGASWRDTIFPQSPDRVEKWIKEDMVKERDTQYLAIVRKADDRVVGSARINRDGGVSSFLTLRVDPLYGERGKAWAAEALTMLVPWIVDEQHRPVLSMFLPADEREILDAAEAAGMRETGRFREMLDKDGARIDRLVLTRLNPLWVETLGDPNDVALERTGTGKPRPVPPKVELERDPPRNAVMVGKRVYLRPEEKGDSELVALWARRETETFFDIGRHLPSAVSFANWGEEHQKPDLPTWIWFTVCLRENDEAIGSVGLIDIDYQHRFAETGSMFWQTKYRNAGYGSEAKQLLLEWAFEELDLHMLQSWVYFPNTRSAAALRKQGYKEAGRINWLYSHDGRFDNFVLFDLLREEWRVMPRAEWADPSADGVVVVPLEVR
ncbi:MAG: GNAT family N-acetyltransferase, partial [Chloroflexota bacterium]|nr:GNAT family N-acetyltransferase [Chloroflexota bacterium]